MDILIPDPAARMCLYVEDQQIKCYANKKALEFIGNEILRIADSDPREHYELHVRLAFLSAALPPGETVHQNAWVVDGTNSTGGVEKNLENDLPDDAVPVGYEVTFMHVTEDELDALKKLDQSSSR